MSGQGSGPPRWSGPGGSRPQSPSPFRGPPPPPRPGWASPVPSRMIQSPPPFFIRSELTQQSYSYESHTSHSSSTFSNATPVPRPMIGGRQGSPAPRVASPFSPPPRWSPAPRTPTPTQSRPIAPGTPPPMMGPRPFFRPIIPVTKIFFTNLTRQ